MSLKVQKTKLLLINTPQNPASKVYTRAELEAIAALVKEFDAIIKPDADSRVLFLGTPQCEDTIYNKLTDRGYRKQIWPAKYVTAKVNQNTYDGTISPICVNDEKAGASTGPLRFSDIGLAEREASYGRTGFSMQFMLDTRLSDLDRYPLKTSDLIVMSVDPEMAPEKLVWARDPKLEWDSSVPNVGLSGDRFYRPMETIGDYIPYTGSVMSIDPSGRGRDETAFSIVKMLNGYLFVSDGGGLQGGYDDTTMKALAMKAKQHKVNAIVVESNFGDGMFVELFKPVLTKVHPCTIEEVRHNIQKERRIIDTLEPVMNQHRLVVDPKVIQDDYESAQRYPHDSQLKYQLIYQLSRLTRQRGAITHDDRLDALSMAVAYWTEQMAQDVDKRIVDRKEDLLKEELDRFLGNFNNNNPTWM